MRKLILVTLLAFSLSIAAFPKKSEAGIIVGLVAGGYLGKGAWMGATLGAVLYGIGFTQCTDSLDVEIWAVFGLPIVIGTTLLDVHAAMPVDQLAESFHQKFAFVDNSEALFTLASATKARAQTQMGDSLDPVTVRFTPAEVAEIFAQTDLTSDQLEEITIALQ
jgi:hypothetical protein